VENQLQDEKPIKHPNQLKKGQCKLPEKLTNDNTDERKEQIRSFAKIIVNILLVDNLKEQS